MYSVVVDFGIKPDKIAIFMPLMLANAKASLRDEPGCLRFDVCWNEAEPSKVFLYELYTDREAFDQHLKTPHFLNFDAKITGMIGQKDVRTFDHVEA